MATLIETSLWIALTTSPTVEKSVAALLALYGIWIPNFSSRSKIISRASIDSSPNA